MCEKFRKSERDCTVGQAEGTVESSQVTAGSLKVTLRVSTVL